MNFDRLEEISGGDKEFEREILQAFVEDARFHIEALKLFLKDSNYVGLGDRAHQLKGASANLGITTLQQLAAKLDTQVKHQDLSGAESLIEQLTQSVQQVEDYVAQNF